MKTTVKLATAILLAGVATTGAFAGKKHFYKTKDGEKVAVCRDQTGFTVYRGDGSTETHGRDVTWDQVKEKYNVKKLQRKSKKRYSECPSA